MAVGYERLNLRIASEVVVDVLEKLESENRKAHC